MKTLKLLIIFLLAILQVSSQSTDALLNKAGKSYNRGNYEKSLELMEEAIKQMAMNDPAYPYVMKRIGDCSYQLEDYENAADHYDYAIKKGWSTGQYYDLIELYFLLGSSYSNSENYKDAIHTFEFIVNSYQMDTRSEGWFLQVLSVYVLTRINTATI